MTSTRSLVRLAVPLLALLLAAPARAADVDRFVPDDSEIVVSVNVKGLLDSPVVKNNVLPQIKAILEDQDVQDVLKDLNFDPLKDLHSVLVAMPGGDNNGDRGLVIVHGKFDTKAFAKVGEQNAKDHPEILKIHKINDGKGGQFLVYELNIPDADMPLFVSVPNDSTILISGGKDYVVDALRKEANKEKAVLKNKDFQKLLEGQDQKQHIAVAAVGSAIARNDSLPEQVKGFFRNIDAVGGGLTFGDDIKIEIVGLAKTAQDAKDLSRSVNDLVTQGAGLLSLLTMGSDELRPLIDILKTIKCTAKDKAVIIKGEVSNDVIEQLLKGK
jgi:hypothetical protein